MFEHIAALRRIKDTGKVKPVYVLYGPEVFFKEEFTAALVRYLEGDAGAGSLDYQFLDGRETSVVEVLNSAKTPPFFASFRLIIVRDVNWFSDDRVADQLLSYLDEPSPSSCIIVTSEKVDRRSRVIKKVGEVGEVIACNTPKGRELASWVKRRARKAGVVIEDDAAWLLIRSLGENLYALVNEIDKMATYVVDGIIDVDVVKRLAAATAVPQVFALLDAVGERDVVTALSALGRILDGKEPALRILHMLVRQVRLLLRACALLEEGCSVGDVQKRLKLHPYEARKICAQTRNFKITELEDAYPCLLDADLALKTSAMPERIVLEKLVIQLCTGRS